VIGSGSKWTNSDFLTIGDSGQGTLTLAAGGQVSNHDSCIGYRSGTGSVTVNGIGSTWTNSGVLYVGFSGSGTLTIEAGGQVSNNDSCIGYNSGSTSSVTVNGIGSTWTNTDRLYVGGTGTLTIEAGGQVSSTFGYIDAGSNSSGTVTVTGNGSKWINSVELYVGNFGTSTLNIGSGIASDGVVAAKYLILANPSSAKGICNLNGGTLQVGSISKGTGTATFNWSDGTIRNYDASTGLAINGNNSLTLKLAATGTHAFYIDAGHTGMVSAILSDATSEGTLTKVGGGLLMLTKENTFTGQMTISAGTLLLYNTGSLASALIDVQSGATFNVSGISGYSLGAGKTLTGSGTVVGNLSVSGIHAPGDSLGIETVKGNYSLLGELQIELAGTTAGSGYDQVLQSGSIAYSTTTLGGKLSLDWTGFSGSTDSTKLWILKNDTAGVLSGTFSNYENGASLGVYDGRAWYIDYGANFATGSLTGGNDVVIFTVPEPATIVLLGMVAMGLGAVGWQRRK
jgi:T5SS/PEP-CTERM-associated repeat protein/autotransporter-associated beta strand protein